jgi:hypothetical protein
MGHYISEIPEEYIKASKNDQVDNKPDYSLLPKVFMDQVSYCMMAGAEKYGRYNYTKGHNINQLLAASGRHLKAIQEGEDVDQDTTDRVNETVYHAADLSQVNQKESSMSDSSKMDTKSISISGKIGYHDIFKPDRFSAGTPKPKYSVNIAVDESKLPKLEEFGLKPAVDKAGNLKTMEAIGVEGLVIKGERLESKGKISIVDADNNPLSGLIGFGSDVIVSGFVSTFTNTYGTFTKFYVDSIKVTNLVTVELDNDAQLSEAVI